MREVAYFQFHKFDARTGEFVGVATSETADQDREIMDYRASKPYFEEWSATTFQRSGGKSFGNVREMHSLQAAGKLTAITFDDRNKRILVRGVIIDAAAQRKAAEGVYSGLSIGGRYVDRFPDPDRPGFTRYVADPTEVSLVDSPNNPDATFELIGHDGVKVRKRFASPETAYDAEIATAAEVFSARALSAYDHLERRVQKTTKRVGGKDLPSSAFAFVGDPNDPSTWKYPIHDASHVRNALARWGQEKGIPASEKAKVYGRIKAAAKRFGVEVSADTEKIIKSLYDVGGIAQALQNLEFTRASLEREAEYEGDNSPVPARLREVMTTLAEVLKEVVVEETDELLALSAATDDDGEANGAPEPVEQAYQTIKAYSHSGLAHARAAAASVHQNEPPEAYGIAAEEIELEVLKAKVLEGDIAARIRLEQLAMEEVRKAIRNPLWAPSGGTAGFRQVRR